MTAVERANFNAKIANLRFRLENERCRLMIQRDRMQRVIDERLSPLAIPHLRNSIGKLEEDRASLERSKEHLTATMELVASWPVDEDRPAEGTAAHPDTIFADETKDPGLHLLRADRNGATFRYKGRSVRLPVGGTLELPRG